jgi:hypothetical protein
MRYFVFRHPAKGHGPPELLVFDSASAAENFFADEAIEAGEEYVAYCDQFGLNPADEDSLWEWAGRNQYGWARIDESELRAHWNEFPGPFREIFRESMSETHEHDLAMGVHGDLREIWRPK